MKIDNLAYTLKRSERNSIGITIERDGRIIVRAPIQLELEKIEDFVSKKRIWIHQKLAKKAATHRERPKREFVNGQGFLYLGKSYRLRFVEGGNHSKSGGRENRVALRLYHGYFELPDSQKIHARKQFISWYKQKTEERLKERLPRYADRIGVQVEKYRTVNLGNRWASYSKTGTISFNWRCVMTPIWVFDYILVHEMAHMIERSHSRRFWRIVSRVMPDYEEQVRWLSENGSDCDL